MINDDDLRNMCRCLGFKRAFNVNNIISMMNDRENVVVALEEEMRRELDGLEILKRADLKPEEPEMALVSTERMKKKKELILELCLLQKDMYKKSMEIVEVLYQMELEEIRALMKHDIK